jgi:hypothetical protein
MGGGSGTWVAVVSGVGAGLGGAWLGLFIMGTSSAGAAKLPASATQPAAATTMNAAALRGGVQGSPTPADTECAASTANVAVGAQQGAGQAAGRPTEEDVARDKKALREEAQNRVMAHQQEPRDASWAREKEGVLTPNLREMSQWTSATLESVECRSVSCLASFSWPNEDIAKAHLYELISRAAPNAVGASRFINLEAGDGNGPAKATMILDWTQAAELPN